MEERWHTTCSSVTAQKIRLWQTLSSPDWKRWTALLYCSTRYRAWSKLCWADLQGDHKKQGFIILLSKDSAESSHVLREVEIAVEGSAAIVPFRIQEVAISDDLEYYLNKVHRLDALTPPIESHIGKLVDTLGTIIDVADTQIAAPIASEGPIINGKKKEAIKEPLKNVNRQKQTSKRQKNGYG